MGMFCSEARFLAIISALVLVRVAASSSSFWTARIWVASSLDSFWRATFSFSISAVMELVISSDLAWRASVWLEMELMRELPCWTADSRCVYWSTWPARTSSMKLAMSAHSLASARAMEEGAMEVMAVQYLWCVNGEKRRQQRPLVRRRRY